MNAFEERRKAAIEVTRAPMRYDARARHDHYDPYAREAIQARADLKALDAEADALRREQRAATAAGAAAQHAHDGDLTRCAKSIFIEYSPAALDCFAPDQRDARRLAELFAIRTRLRHSRLQSSTTASQGRSGL